MGSDFRLNRSRHPTAVGRGLVWRRIGSPPGDGWAARRDPKGNRRVFYDAGLYIYKTHEGAQYKMRDGSRSFSGPMVCKCTQKIGDMSTFF